MTLRQRLILLHSAFAVFAVGAAIATIYAVQWEIEHATRRFGALVDDVQYIEGLRGDLRTLDVHMHDMIAGGRILDNTFEEQARACLTRLGEVASFSGQDTGAATNESDAIRELGAELDTTLASCLRLLKEGQNEAACILFTSPIEDRLLPVLDTRLRALRDHLDLSRQQASGAILERGTRLLLLALLIGVSGVGLVLAGALIVRRRLVGPIRALQDATEAFAAGNLEHRVATGSTDELGRLGAALNNMAGALQVSQRKYRTLFENLRDTVVICDSRGTVRECHEGDGDLLGSSAHSAVGKRADSVWPKWRFGRWTPRELVERVVAEDQPLRMNDVAIEGSFANTTIVDVVAYGVDYAGARYAAIVMRDVTERHSLQKLVRRADAMEVAVNFARGISHDFKNLLHCASATLHLIEESTQEPGTAERTKTAMEACRQAASLSRRLTNFAADDEGRPETLCLSETVRVIVGSLGERFLENIRLEMACDKPVHVRIDRDQLTQIVLNLVYNARDAMPEGGMMRIATDVAEAADPLSGGVRGSYAILTVRDSGMGMTENVIENAFKPLYTTKPQVESGPRGMGLAVVYAAVTNAGGFIKVETRPGAGTTFQVCLPVAKPADSTGSGTALPPLCPTD